MGLKVLIVDDSSVVRQIVERNLRQMGLPIETVLEAADGLEALEHISRNSIDLILSDINMPNMDGLELLRQIKKLDLPKAVPVVMLTTEGTRSKVMEAVSLGVRGYIRKPFTSEEFRQQIGPLVGK